MERPRPVLPVSRSFLGVLVLNLVTLGMYWFYYLHRMFSHAAAMRGEPFFAKTYWTMVILAAATIVTALVAGLGPAGEAWGQAAYMQNGSEVELEQPQVIRAPPGGISDQADVAATLFEGLVVASSIAMAAFLFVEVASFRPAICSPLALPMLVLAQLPFVFLPQLWFGTLIVGLLTLVAWHDLHRGLVAFFDGDLEPDADLVAESVGAAD